MISFCCTAYSSRFVSDLRQIGGFPPGTPVSSTNKTDYNDTTEILLKVALNTINKQTNRVLELFYMTTLRSKFKTWPWLFVPFPLNILQTKDFYQTGRLTNSDILLNLNSKEAHLRLFKNKNWRLWCFPLKIPFQMFLIKPSAACHDIGICDASPIKQHPCLLNLLKLECMRPYLKYMLDDIIEPNISDLNAFFSFDLFMVYIPECKQQLRSMK